MLARSLTLVRWLVVAASGAGALTFAPEARAQALDGGDGEDYATPKAERRNGFMAPLQTEYGYMSVEGYHKKLGETGLPEYRSHIGGVGGTFALVLGGVLRDWLTAGLVLRTSGVTGNDNTVVGGISGVGLQLQGFPLWSRGGAWRDVGLVGEFGVGLGGILDNTDSDDPDVLADGGGMSHVGVGLSYEVFKFWLFSAGPVVNYSHQFSQSMSSHIATAGIKLTFYSAQP